MLDPGPARWQWASPGRLWMRSPHRRNPEMWMNWLRIALSTVFIGKEKGKTVRGVEGLGCCSKAATFAKTHWVQVGLEESVQRGWEEEKEALVPSRCRAEFLQQWPFGTEETEGCSWKNLGISMYPCISSHRDKEKTTVDKASLYHGDDKNTGLGFRDWVSKFTVIVFIFLFIFLHLPQVLSGHVDSLPLNISSSNVCLCNTGD